MAQQQRFMRRGITKILWLKAIAAPSHVPTRAELTAPNAFDLTDTVADVDGWSLTNDSIETPDMASTFSSSIPGIDKADKSAITFYEDEQSETVEGLLSKGAFGYVVFLRKGDNPGSKSMDVFPAQVASRTALYNAGNEAAKFKVDMTVISPPALDAPVPARAGSGT
ncbi:hypothetical protein [Streptomyces luteireticuli]|uniref:phage tail tube protein n=1 Tax=Streptomyces luteireticuli TaxID=173858 RepID=UPI0035590DDD